MAKFGEGNLKNVKEIGRKGGIATGISGNNILKKLWKDEEWSRKKRKESSERIKKVNLAMTKEEFREHCSNAGKKSRKRENRIIERIREDYDKLFMPFRVCDRIAIKGNKIIFIEVKKKSHRKLTPKQQEFKEICEKLGFEYHIHTD